MNFTADYHYGKLLEDPWVEKRIHNTLDLIDLFCKQNNYKDLSVLDFGGYDGNLITLHNHLKLNLISDYTIIDGDSSALKKAEQKGYNTKYLDLNTLEKLSLDKKFDCVIATEVLEHLVNPRLVLSLLIKYLKPNGFLVISLPNENTFIHRLYSFIGIGLDTEAFNLYKHLHLPTLKQSAIFLGSQTDIVLTKNWFHFGGNGSKISMLSFKPNSIISNLFVFIGNIFPNLLARGRIYICIPLSRN